MPATTTLSTTTLSDAVSASERNIKVASTSGLTAGTRLYADRELMSVVSLGVSTSAYSTVEVRRGVDGTTATPHTSGITLTIGRADEFYSTDPVGVPGESILVSPYINVTTGDFWYAQGDATPGNPNRNRWWQKRSTTYSDGALGVREATNTPSSST